MNQSACNFRVLMVCTRDIPDEPKSGRERTMAFITSTLRHGAEVRTLQLRSLLENPSPSRIAYAAILGIRRIASRRNPMPLQCLLFSDHRFRRRLVDTVEQFKPSTVYFDGVRSGMHATFLRERYPHLRIVCDFDDLMSRRVQLLSAAGERISLGYLKRFLPGWAHRHVLGGWIGGRVLDYEQFALRSVENRILRACDCVVLVSSVDAAEWAAARSSDKVTVIPPVMPSVPSTASRASECLLIRRFVFVGSDELVQNRQSIDFLLSLWRRVLPETSLHIFGRQTRSYPECHGVHFHGFVPDVASAYEPGSVLLAPSFLGGGVKTKVLEAIAYGIVPVGTRSTFEGIEAITSGLVLAPDNWESLVADPNSWAPHLERERKHVSISAAKGHSAATLGAKWRHVIWP